MHSYNLKIINTTSSTIEFKINYTEQNLNISNIKLTYNNTLITGLLGNNINSNPTFTLDKINDNYIINLINFKLSYNDLTTLLVDINNSTSNTLIIASYESLYDYSTTLNIFPNYIANGIYKINADIIGDTQVSNISSGPFILCNDINLEESSISLTTSNSNLVVYCNLITSTNDPVPAGKYRLKFKYKKL